ncbi:MAG: hypothetical protein E7253_08010 [Lachnospiraceae bacterium]|nr:hypothetical protein [Lachnospiraceae bacterium]
MWTLLFTVLMFLVFGKLLLFAVRAAWSISKIFVSLIMLPISLVLLVVFGLIRLALPLLLIIGLISLLTVHD